MFVLVLVVVLGDFLLVLLTVFVFVLVVVLGGFLLVLLTVFVFVLVVVLGGFLLVLLTVFVLVLVVVLGGFLLGLLGGSHRLLLTSAQRLLGEQTELGPVDAVHPRLLTCHLVSHTP